MKDLTQLRELLEKETYPLEFIHKFIGRNTPDFARGVGAFESAHPQLRLQTARTSAGDAHVAMTYVFVAGSVDEILGVFDATSLIPDVLIVL